MGKEIVNQVQEAQRVSHRINPRRSMPKHIVIKKEKKLKIMREYKSSKGKTTSYIQRNSDWSFS